MQIETVPTSILHKSIAGRYRPVRVADGPISARYRFIKNANWGLCSPFPQMARGRYIGFREAESISDNTKEMPQSRSTAFPRRPKKGR